MHSFINRQVSFFRQARRACLGFSWSACLCAALFAWGGAARAEAPAQGTALDMTAQCTITASYNTERIPDMLNDDLMTFWEAPMDTAAGMRPYVQVETPADAPAFGLYIVWAYHPTEWQLMIENPDWAQYEYLGDDDPESQPRWVRSARYGTQGFVHEYVPLDGLTHFRLQPLRLADHPFAIVSLHVLGEGELPDWVQTWQPIQAPVDLMVIAAHPDDEMLFFGGTLPYYAGERKLNTAVVYMTFSSRYRVSELLNGLWIAGVRGYPVLGDLLDVYSSSAAQAGAICGEEEASAFIVEQLRRYKPKVVVTHDLDGEYGHGMHRLTAAKTLEAVADLSWDEKCFPESAAAYGVCDVDKLYLHLYPEGAVTMDWRAPLDAFSGKSGFEMAELAFAQHLTQQDFQVEPEESDRSCFRFGLAATMVGPDELGKDFFENITLWSEEVGQ